MTLQRLALLFAWVKRGEAAGVMQITRKSLNWQEIGTELAALSVYGKD
jgi:hypothetical protein